MRWLFGLLVLVAISLIGTRALAPGVFEQVRPGPTPYSEEAFAGWRMDNPDEAARFEALADFLDAEGVGSVVPAWQLTRTDNNSRRTCERPQFLVPPRESWGRIVPVLKLVRDHVVPEIGPVEVSSSYRTTAFNDCIGGASRSRHLDFAAVDLRPIETISNPELFRRLCALQQRLGPSSRFGLGAYFDPSRPGKASGRFHVDVSGYRNWGYSQHADSSGCRAFQQRN